MEKELWKPVRGYSGFYEVSSFGRVRSLDRVSRTRWDTPNPLRGKVLCPVYTGYGKNKYPSITFCRPGKRQRLPVHVVVLLAFVGPRPFRKAEGCHWDGNRKNNKVSNLRWATRKENAQDAVRHGTILRGEENKNSKLTVAQVRKIKASLRDGVPGVARHRLKRTLARMYSVTWENIKTIEKGQTWKSVA